MAEPEAAVLDTHALIFHAAGGRGLGPKAQTLLARAEQRQAIVYVPAVVMWECSLLARVGRVNFRRSIRTFFDDLFSNPAYQPLGIDAEDVFLADDLRFTRDPFDALIVAAAVRTSLPLVTRDGDIRASGTVRVIW